MGGGSDGYSIGPARDSGESQAAFDKTVDEAKRARLRNVFISFHVDDEVHVGLLRSQAKNENYDLEFRDYSVKEPFDEKWKTNCKQRIAQTSVVVVMIGEHTAEREAVNWEIEEAYRQGKRVVGVRIYKDKNHEVPKAMRDNRAPILDWNLKYIDREINKP
jgi:hypothetical protein